MNYKIIKEFLQQIFVKDHMGNQQDSDEKLSKKTLKVQEWQIYNKQSSIHIQISGLFYNQLSHSKQHYFSFYVDEQRIYFKDMHKIRFLPLFLTRMQQKFYYHNKKRIYGVQLVHNNKTTILSTENKQSFIIFYCHLAQYCILNNFQRHFTVKEQIGKGSYGTVYRGINRLSNQEVALKVFYKNILFKQKQQKQYNYFTAKTVQNQIYVLEKLKKANLSPLYQVFQTNDCLILVLEMAKYGDLLSYLLKDDVIVNDQLFKNVLKKILQNLQALHKAGFVHRDIKPENIVFRKTHGHISLFICDFSIAINLQDQYFNQLKQIQAGSRGFVAPEVLKNNCFNQKCDTFSFGCLIFLLLSGNKLFEQKSNQQIVILTEDNNFIHQQIHGLKIPRMLKKLLRKLLEVDPYYRISASQALKDEYFSDKQQQKPFLFENDQTIKQFIEKRICMYESSTRGGTSVKNIS